MDAIIEGMEVSTGSFVELVPELIERLANNPNDPAARYILFTIAEIADKHHHTSN